MTETAGADTAGVDIVFGDAAGTDDGARNANHSSRSAYRVVSAALSVAKISTLICDPFNGTTNPKHIPGAIVRWTITITNTGAASASLSTVADAINAAPRSMRTWSQVPAEQQVASSATGTPENAAGRGFKLDVTGDTRAQRIRNSLPLRMTLMASNFERRQRNGHFRARQCLSKPATPRVS